MFYCLKSGTNSVVFWFAYSTANESTHESQHHQGQRRAQLTHQGRGRSGCWGWRTEKSPMKSPKWNILNTSFSCVKTTCWRPRSRLLKMLLSWDVLYHNWTQSSCSLPLQTRGITCKSNNGRGGKKKFHSFNKKEIYPCTTHIRCFMEQNWRLYQNGSPRVGECSIIPGVISCCFCKLYRHLPQAFSSVSAHCSWSHSSYTPYCLHLMPPICTEQKWVLSQTLHASLTIKVTQKYLSFKRERKKIGLIAFFVLLCMNEPIGFSQEWASFVLWANGKG